MPNNVKNSSLSSPVYLQVCSVCKKEFSRRKDWLKHLTQDKHQKLARKQCIAKWGSRLRKCCLIVYTSKPLTDGRADEIVNNFSREINGGKSIAMVTDFVWWKTRPCIGILQFESRETTEHILKATGCQNSLKVRISDSQWIQVKKGVDLLELEWNAILPLKVRKTSLTTSKSKRTLPPQLHWTLASHPLQYEYWTIIQKTILPPDPPEKTELEKQLNRLFNYLCQFDPRCHALISLINYWTTQNSIYFCGKPDTDNLLELPPHHTTKWLVIFFLCHKKYLPTPREIIERNLNKIIMKDEVTGTNIGFHCDPAHVQEWKLEKGTSQEDPVDEFSEEFIKSVLQLLYKFFSFGVSCKMKDLAFIPDGMLINVGKLQDYGISPLKLNGKETVMWTNEEINGLMIQVEEERLSEEFCGFHMTHPFLLSHKFSLAKDIKTAFKYCTVGQVRVFEFLKKLKTTGEQICGLKHALTVYKP